MNNLISVIIPVYNGDKTLTRCLRSVLNQAWSNIEIIVVDDGSTDKSVDIANEFSKKNKNIVLLQHESNMGLFQARITGVEHSHGDYIGFIDADDYISVDWFSSLIERAEESSADIVAGEVVLDYGEHKSYYTLDPFWLKDFELLGKDLLKYFIKTELSIPPIFWTIWSKLYRKSLWDKCIPFFKKLSIKLNHFVMWEDLVFSMYLFLNSNKFANIHHSYYFYDKVNSSAYTVVASKNKKILKYLSDSKKTFLYLKDFFLNKDYEISDEEKYSHKRLLSKFVSYIYNFVNYALKDNPKLLRKYEKKIKDEFNYDLPKEYETSFDLESNELNFFFEKYEKIKEIIIDPNTEFVSFDIFDTLIERPFLEPTDLFDFLTDFVNENFSSYIDFKRIRVEIEQECRKKKFINNKSEDVTIDEIYNEIALNTNFSPIFLSKVKEKEIELEKHFCMQRKIGKKLYDLAKLVKKRILIVTDMYLNAEIIIDILSKNGYAGYDYLFVSSDVKLSKYTGNIYNYILQKIQCGNPQKIVHIGDNYDSDYVNARNKEINAFQIFNSSDLIKNKIPDFYSGNMIYDIFGYNGRINDFWNSFCNYPALRHLLKIVAINIFENPFICFNQNSNFNGSPKTIGFYCIGFHVLSVCSWLIEKCKSEKIKTIHFCARDGYLYKKAFDILVNALNLNIETNYIRVSRDVVFLFDVNCLEDLYGISHKFYKIEETTPIQLLNKITPLLCDENLPSLLSKINIDSSEPFKSFSGFSAFIKQLDTNHFLNFEKLKKYKDGLRCYFSQIIKPNDYIFEIGYSGRVEGAFSALLEYKVNSFYIHANFVMANKIQNRYGLQNYCFFHTKPEVTGSIRELIVSERAPKALSYTLNDNNDVNLVFETYIDDFSQSFVIDILQSEALKFVDSYCKTFCNFIEFNELPLQSIAAPLEFFLHFPKFHDKKIFQMVMHEDLLNKISKSVLEDWQVQIHTPPNHNSSSFIVFSKFIDKLLPKGSLRRKAIKKFLKFNYKILRWIWGILKKLKKSS